jgi:hypothetical protein
MKSRVAILIFVCVALSILALTAPFGRGVWSQIPADFRLPLLGFFSNLVLVGVTWAYVLITRDQLRELRTAREPKAVLNARVPQINVEDIRYGRGHNQFRSGPPIYLDVWNVSGPTIMVTQVTVRVKDARPKERVRFAPLQPQRLVESDKVASINVGYHLMHLVSPESEECIDFPDQATAEARFTVDYFSLRGEGFIEACGKFRFVVTEESIVTMIEEWSGGPGPCPANPLL